MQKQKQANLNEDAGRMDRPKEYECKGDDCCGSAETKAKQRGVGDSMHSRTAHNWENRSAGSRRHGLPANAGGRRWLSARCEWRHRYDEFPAVVMLLFQRLTEENNLKIFQGIAIGFLWNRNVLLVCKVRCQANRRTPLKSSSSAGDCERKKRLCHEADTRGTATTRSNATMA